MVVHDAHFSTKTKERKLNEYRERVFIDNDNDNDDDYGKGRVGVWSH